ncbi:MFS transporter [Planctomicrobium sp. SH664]|uniref:MFS transporter n=1 Tax=Planctomicrobium sp. SH664 TaxID=3448125 RepID=UPI003F5C408C
MSSNSSHAAVPNAHRLLWAGFVAILATGIGFAVRGAVMKSWASMYGFTDTQLGAIGMQGLTGFCFGVIIGGLVADKIGYGRLIVAAFLLHLVSAGVSLAPTASMSNAEVFSCLYWGSFIFAVANGTLESVANPLIATVFPQNRTHYLNILHASWPLGLVLGAAIAFFCGPQGANWHWKMQLGTFLIPAILYGLLFLGQKMPKSEASEKGLSLGEMLKDVGLLGGLVICFLLSVFFQKSIFQPLLENAMDAGKAATMATYLGYGIGGTLLIAIGFLTRFSIGSFLLFILFITHAMIGAVELGTDTWIQNITGVIFTERQGNLLFIATSLIMFGLRFCAHFIEKKSGLSPVGLLLVCAILACIGLNLTANVSTFATAFLALGVYGVGKTFFWPTMLAVASDRFPRTGAVAISIMGGIGMMAGGLVGAGGLGYLKDKFSGEALAKAGTAIQTEYQATNEGSFPILSEMFPKVRGIDPVKLKKIEDEMATARTKDPKAGYDVLSAESRTVLEASVTGARNTLTADSVLPATMAVIYLILVIYFKSIGGYKAVHLAGTAADNVSDEDESLPAHG